MNVMSNKKLLMSFNIPLFTELLEKRQNQWIAKLSQMPDSCLPKRLLTAWCHIPKYGTNKLEYPIFTLCTAFKNTHPDIAPRYPLVKMSDPISNLHPKKTTPPLRITQCQTFRSELVFHDACPPPSINEQPPSYNHHFS